MKRTITLLLCASLVSLPLRAEEETIQPQSLFGVLLVGLAVITVGTVSYVVVKADKAQKERERCTNCAQAVKKADNFCPACGIAQRCDGCDTRLPKGSLKCPACGDKVPPPQPTLTIVQTSANGGEWGVFLSHQSDLLRFEREIESLQFKSQEDFSEWRDGREVYLMIQLPYRQQQFFRAASKP